MQTEKELSRLPTIAGVEIAESVTSQDFELTKLYQSYSSELLRLSLAGIGVVGFLIVNLGLLNARGNVKPLIGFGIIALVIAAGFALLHRYLSSDSMAFLIAHLRCNTQAKQNLDVQILKSVEARAESELEGFRTRLAYSDWSLRGSAISLAVGVFSISIGIVLKLMN